MKILVVVDMQYDFTTGPLGNKECAAVIPNVISAIKNDTYDHIIFTKDTHQNNYLQTQEGQKLPVPHCIEGSDGWNIVDEVFCAADGKHIEVVCKPTFGSVELGELLERYSNESEEPVEVDFCGGMHRHLRDQQRYDRKSFYSGSKGVHHRKSMCLCNTTVTSDCNRGYENLSN